MYKIIIIAFMLLFVSSVQAQESHNYALKLMPEADKQWRDRIKLHCYKKSETSGTRNFCLVSNSVAFNYCIAVADMQQRTIDEHQTCVFDLLVYYETGKVVSLDYVELKNRDKFNTHVILSPSSSIKHCYDDDTVIRGMKDYCIDADSVILRMCAGWLIFYRNRDVEEFDSCVTLGRQLYKAGDVIRNTYLESQF